MLAAAGVASRRDAAALIAAGKVSVNGQVVRETGAKVDPDRDHIAVDGKGIPRGVEKLYIALNKPVGYVTTKEDPHAQNIVMDLVRAPLEARLGKNNPAIEALHPVGRLDTQTEGLLLLTNDGAFTQALTHPRHGVPKVYMAEVKGIPDAEALERLRVGIPLYGRKTLPARVRIRRVDRGRGMCSLEVEIREGRNQQIRRMLQAVGFPVARLKRIAIGRLGIERLRPKHWRFLTEAEVEGLMEAARGSIETADVEPRPRPRRSGQMGAGRKAERAAPPGKRPSGPGKPRAPRAGEMIEESPIPPRAGGGPRGPRAPESPAERRPRGTEAPAGRRPRGRAADSAHEPRPRPPRPRGSGGSGPRPQNRKK